MHLPAALLNLDLQVLQATSQAVGEWGLYRPLHYLAEYLIGLFPLVLLVLWRRPQLRGERHGAQKAVVIAAVSLVLAMAAKSFLAYFIQRDRPFVDHPDLALVAPTDPGSFPSGHTMVAFAVATSLLLSGYRKLGWSLMAVAVLVGLSRMLVGVHYLSDVLAGALVGVLSSWYLHREASSLRRYLPNH